MFCFPYVKYLVDECSQLQNIKCFHFRKSSVKFTIRRCKWYFTAYFSVSSEKMRENKAQKLIVLSISLAVCSSCQEPSWFCKTRFSEYILCISVKMPAGQSVHTNYIKLLGDVMRIRGKTNVFSNQNYPHPILIKLLFTEGSWRPVLHFLMIR